VGLQARYRGYDRSDASGDSDRDIEQIVDHQSRRGQEPRIGAEVLISNRVGATARRIGCDGLAIAQFRRSRVARRPRRLWERYRKDQLLLAG
jgi:hypothetical protein